MNRNDPAPSIWLVQDLPRKIAKGTLDRDTIAAAAAQILDETGLESFTMRNLCRRLGISAMACYAKVRNKDDALELAQDHVMGQLTVRERDWQVVLRTLADDYCTLLVNHSWLPTLAGRFLNAGPNVRAITRAAARHLSMAGLPDPLVPSALSASFILAHGHRAIEVAWRSRMTEADLDELTRAASPCRRMPIPSWHAEPPRGPTAQGRTTGTSRSPAPSQKLRLVCWPPTEVNMT